MKRENPDKPKLYRSRSGITLYLAAMFDGVFDRGRQAIARRVSHTSDMDRIVDQDLARRENEDKFPSRRKRLRSVS